MALVLLKERSTLWRAGGSNPNSNFDLRPYIRIYYEQTAQDKALLRTRVVTNYYMQFYSKTSGSVSGYDEGSYSNYIDNSNKGWVSYSKSLSYTAGYSLFYVGQTSSYIYHNQATGKASFNYQLYNQFDGDIYSTGVSGTLSVPTIQTSFAVSISNFDLGQNPTITVGVTNTSYNYELKYSIGALSGTIASNQTASTYIWEMDETLKNDIREEMATTKTKTLTITCETYDGETSKGTKTATCTLTINEKPTIQPTPLILELNSDVYSYNNPVEYVVKNLSSLKFTINATAPYGTTISIYSVRANSEKIATSNSNEVVINDISTHIIDNEEKKVNFYVSVTDARGNTSEETLVTLLFIDYIKSDYINTECLVTRAEDFDYCDISLKGNFFDENIGTTTNELTLGYKYKEKGSTGDYTTGITVLKPPTTVGKNLFNKNNIILDYRISGTNGSNYYEVGYYVSEFIKIDANTVYTKNSPLEDAYHRFAFYTDNNVESFISLSSSNTETTPNDAKYLRFCGLQSELNTTQLEKGSVATEYEPYTTKITTDNVFTVSTTLEEIFDHTKNYEIVFTINDKIYTGEEMTKNVATSEYIMLEHENGVDFKDIFVKGKKVEANKTLAYKRLTENALTIDFNTNMSDGVYRLVALINTIDNTGISMKFNDITPSGSYIALNSVDRTDTTNTVFSTTNNSYINTSSPRIGVAVNGYFAMIDVNFIKLGTNIRYQAESSIVSSGRQRYNKYIGEINAGADEITKMSLFTEVSQFGLGSVVYLFKMSDDI